MQPGMAVLGVGKLPDQWDKVGTFANFAALLTVPFGDSTQPGMFFALPPPDGPLRGSNAISTAWFSAINWILSASSAVLLLILYLFCWCDSAGKRSRRALHPLLDDVNYVGLAQVPGFAFAMFIESAANRTAGVSDNRH